MFQSNLQIKTVCHTKHKDYQNDNITTLRIVHDIVQELQHMKYAAEILVQVRIFLWHWKEHKTGMLQVYEYHSQTAQRPKGSTL